MNRLNGLRICIVGGSSGIGFETAKSLASLGAEIIISSRNKKNLEKAAAEIKGIVSIVAFDAKNEDECQRAMQSIKKIDHLVLALSGGKGGGPFSSIESADLKKAFEGKFWPHFSLAQKSLPYLSQSGSITFVSAGSARAALPGTAGLSAVNSAIEGLIKPLAVELKPLRINAVSPGVIDTPWWDSFPENQKHAMFKKFATITPVGRVGKPQDVAEAIVFLITNSFMTGCVIECDGGLRLGGQLP
jgi:NAD(P)-dependent dehydrogenase (short-subunit alcohol dehydrogenase family)